MASVNYMKTNIVLVFINQETMDGKPEYKRITLANVRHDLTPDEIDQFTLELASLLKYDLYKVERILYESIE